MNLSPLRKQVESLNKDLESQNIQIKDLIRFLNKTTPTNAVQKHQSPKSNLKNILKQKDCFSEDRILHAKDEKKQTYRQLKESKSLKYLKPFNPIKNNFEESSKYITSRVIPMTKSVTFHNIHNALTTRKYLKLSRPEKKMNSSCSFCREATFGSNTISDCSKIHKVSSKVQTETKMTESKHFLEKPENIMKKSFQQEKSKTKLKQVSNKNTPLKELGCNEILSKHEVKSFIERKSKAGAVKRSQSKSKTKLLLKDDQKYKNFYGMKK